MSQVREYQQLHFFLDESGGFRNQDMNLVGGVIVLGPYDNQADEAVLQILRESVQDCQGVFPRDLHFFQTNLLPPRKQRLCELIAERLAAWLGDQREIFGIAIRHRYDLFPQGSNLLAEREYDNRYLQMLYALIEFVCFVYPGIRSKLRPTAEVRVYVGQRHFPLPNSPENQRLLSQLGYEFVSSREPDQLLVKSITRRELRGLVRAGIRQSWPNTQLCFQEMAVLRISYDLSKPPTQPAGL